MTVPTGSFLSGGRESTHSSLRRAFYFPLPEPPDPSSSVSVSGRLGTPPPTSHFMELSVSRDGD